MSTQSTFINIAVQTFKQYKELAEKAMNQVPDNCLYQAPNESSNSIAVIMQHMYGNMLSRFTDFLTSDGEKPTRNRDAEFEAQQLTKTELIHNWNKGWDCVFAAIENLENEDLQSIVVIRAEKQTVEKAIIRQIAHYSYHVGQIVFLAKIHTDNVFQSLSIPKGESEKYNQQMMEKK